MRSHPEMDANSGENEAGMEWQESVESEHAASIEEAAERFEMPQVCRSCGDWVPIYRSGECRDCFEARKGLRR